MVMHLTEHQEAWLVALESGDYEQTDQQLRGGDSFCCLGVACDLSKRGVWNNDEYVTDESSYDTTLPTEVVSEYGFLTDEGRFRSEVRMPTDRLDDNGDEIQVAANSLIELNDTHGYTFTQIAAFVRANPELVFNTPKEVVPW